MQIRHLILLTLSVILNKIQLGTAQNITCDYENIYYTCNLNTQNWKYSSDPIRIYGQHLDDKKNSDVQNLFIGDPNLLRVFNTIFCIRFSNLEQITTENAQIELVEGSALAPCRFLKMLHLRGNKFTELPENLLARNKKLNHFTVSESQLQALPDNFFSEQLELQSLNLESNELEFLPSKIFQPLVKLEALRLSDNRLQSLDPEWFSNLQNLQTLDFVGNQITELPPKIFKALSNLLQLYLDDNRITFISPESFIGLKNIKILLMRGNSISDFPKSAFLPLKAMEELWMSDNILETIHSDSFGLNLKNLRLLDMENNKINSIDPKFIDNHDWSSLEMQGNVCCNISIKNPKQIKSKLSECFKNYRPRSQLTEYPSRIQTNMNSCGKPFAAKGNILGGIEIPKGSVPWIAALVRIGSGEFFCGGTVISVRKILTGAHCIWPKFDEHPKQSKDFFVLLGIHDRNKTFEVGRTTNAVRQIKIHEDWNPYTLAYDADIAVIILDHPVTFNSYIQPVCLIPASSPIVNLKNAIVVGYGKSEDKKLENIPKFVESPIRDHLECFNKNHAHQSILSGRALCSGYGHGKGVCPGDSGGGLYVNQNGVFYQRGIVSSSISGGPFGCEVNDYAVFTDTAKFYDWIQEISDN